MQDKISLLFQLGRLLEKETGKVSGKQWTFNVVEAKKQKKVSHQKSCRKKTIKTPLGRFKTVKVKQTAEGSTRATDLWFARDKQHLLVKIAQYNKGQR